MNEANEKIIAKNEEPHIWCKNPNLRGKADVWISTEKKIKFSSLCEASVGQFELKFKLNARYLNFTIEIPYELNISTD